MSHPLDRQITLSDKPYTLRFSICALAEIASKLGAKSPARLADYLRISDFNKQRETGLILLAALMIGQEVSSVSDVDLQAVLPLIADMIVEAFHV
jgi:hypothetical protein